MTKTKHTIYQAIHNQRSLKIWLNLYVQFFLQSNFCEAGFWKTFEKVWADRDSNIKKLGFWRPEQSKVFVSDDF